jgi:hypothetical protein
MEIVKVPEKFRQGLAARSQHFAVALLGSKKDPIFSKRPQHCLPSNPEHLRGGIDQSVRQFIGVLIHTDERF